jgi:hypothetical protein
LAVTMEIEGAGSGLAPAFTCGSRESLGLSEIQLAKLRRSG